MAVYLYKFGGQRPKAFTAAYPFPWYGEHDRAIEKGAMPISMRERKKMLRQQATLFDIRVD